MHARVSSFLLRWVQHPLEAAAAVGAYFFLRLLPLDLASAAGGWLGRTLGPWLSLHRRAERNLRRAFPDMADAEVARVLRGMWDNLGRVAGEYPHLTGLRIGEPDGRVEVRGGEWADTLRDDGRPGIFVSGHLANWEVISLCATQRGLVLHRIYRAANNRLVEWLYRRGRAAVEGALLPKGPASVRPLLRLLADGGHVGMLVDQKMNDGIAVPFFGIPAMTAPAVAELAYRFDCPIVPVRCVRLKGARFRVDVEPPIDVARTGDRRADVAATLTGINAIIERWVREHPEQWLWVHNRWPDP